MPREVDLADILRSLRSLVLSARSTSLGTCSLPRDRNLYCQSALVLYFPLFASSRPICLNLSKIILL